MTALGRYLPAAYLLRSCFRASLAGAAWLAGADTTAHILAVLAVMSLVGPIEITAAKDIVRAAGARKRAGATR